MTPELNSAQLRALDILETNDNVFLTGGAGSGKSFLLTHYLRESMVDYPILASTGAAAVLVGGRTFHSYFGLGIMEGGIAKTVKSATANKRVVQRLRDASGIVIDEISMIPGLALEAAENIARQARKSSAPWGGLRIIVVGDFSQLPPVTRAGQQRDWAFESRAWREAAFTPAVLDTIIRSKDEEFLEVLNYVRHGVVNDLVRLFLDGRTRPLPRKFEGTRLFSRRDATEAENLARLEDLPGEAMEFTTTYTGKGKHLDAIMKNAPVPEVIRLKKNALVMMRFNDPDGGWVNGSLAYVRKLSQSMLTVELLKNGLAVELERSTFDYLDEEGKKVASATNFPVTLAYATTIHKAQGMTLDSMAVDLSQLWEPGQAYVALSRVRSPQMLFVSRWTPGSIKVAPEVVEFHRTLMDTP